MRILISTLGSVGDAEPFVRLGAALRARGHDARLHANEVYADRATRAGLPITVTGTAEQQRAFRDDPSMQDSRSGLARIAAGVCERIPAALARLEAELVPGDTLLVASTFAFAPRLLAEAQGLPLAVAHLSPANFRSEHEAPRLTPLGHLTGWPRWFKRGMWRMMDRRALDPAFAVPLNAQRAALGLPPVSRVFDGWLHLADTLLGLFPDWFATPQPDWPARLRLTGFPMPSGAAPALDPGLQAWLDAGPPPVVFTAGTALAAPAAFEAAIAQACSRLGLRGLLIGATGPAEAGSPLARWPQAPFESLLPRAAAIVHHGGVGTTAQALAAGIPQLIRPVAFDQLDNASRARRLGVAGELMPRRFDGPRLAAALSRLLDDPQVRRSCASARDRIAQDTGVESAVDALLGTAMRGH